MIIRRRISLHIVQATIFPIEETQNYISVCTEMLVSDLQKGMNTYINDECMMLLTAYAFEAHTENTIVSKIPLDAGACQQIRFNA